MRWAQGANMGFRGRCAALAAHGAIVRGVRALVVAATVLGAALAPTEAAAQFGSIMKGVAGGVGAAGGLPSAKAKSEKAATEGQPSAMSMQAPSRLPPLRKLGTDAVAVVEAASPKAPVQAMDYVFAKQSINLGPSGRLTLSYLSGCLTEVIQGGVVSVDLGGSTVAGGKRQARSTPGCRTAKPIILASASEAGATVNRVTPFSDARWDERALKSGRPVFKWDKALGAVTLRVRDMDTAGEPVLWEASFSDGVATYPPNGARLVTGEPYKVEALSGQKVVASALFSIDPALDVADSLANRVVPLATP